MILFLEQLESITLLSGLSTTTPKYKTSHSVLIDIDQFSPQAIIEDPDLVAKMRYLSFATTTIEGIYLSFFLLAAYDCVGSLIKKQPVSKYVILSLLLTSSSALTAHLLAYPLFEDQFITSSVKNLIKKNYPFSHPQTVQFAALEFMNKHFLTIQKGLSNKLEDYYHLLMKKTIHAILLILSDTVRFIG